MFFRPFQTNSKPADAWEGAGGGGGGGGGGVSSACTTRLHGDSGIDRDSAGDRRDSYPANACSVSSSGV